MNPFAAPFQTVALARRSLARSLAAVGALATVTACLAGPASADDAARVGTVLAARGDVSTESSGALRPLAANAPVHERDSIVAGEGKAKIALDDGTIISVAEHTRVRIGMFTKAATVVRTRIELVSGALRVLVAKVAPAGAFEIETETAIAAVRGTDWLLEATPSKTSVVVLSGRVVVVGRDPNARGAVVLARVGQGTDVLKGAAPTAPAPWKSGRLADLLARATFN